MKPCSKCGVEQPLEDFHRNKSSRDGRTVWCKECNRASAGRWNRSNPEQRLATRRAWASENRADIRAKAKARYAANPRAVNLSRYRMTPAEYDAMFESQGGTCAICKERPYEKQRLVVDHDHGCCPGTYTCGKCVRGLLHSKCNTRLQALETPTWRLAAEAYLSETSVRTAR